MNSEQKRNASGASRLSVGLAAHPFKCGKTWRNSMIKPTIGRVVLVHRGMSDQAEPALVCYVHNDRLINVGGFGSDGTHFTANNIPLLQDDDRPNPHPMPPFHAEWMPYQKLAAEKAA